MDYLRPSVLHDWYSYKKSPLLTNRVDADNFSVGLLSARDRKG